MTKLLGLLLVLAAAPALAMGTYDHQVTLVAWNAAGTSARLRSSYDYAAGKHVDYFIIGATGPVRSFSLGGDAVDTNCAPGAHELNQALAKQASAASASRAARSPLAWRTRRWSRRAATRP